jgi:hypothetical protein
MRISSFRLDGRLPRFKFTACYLQRLFVLILSFNLQNLFYTAKNLSHATFSTRSHSSAPFAALLQILRALVHTSPEYLQQFLCPCDSQNFSFLRESWLRVTTYNIIKFLTFTSENLLKHLSVALKGPNITETATDYFSPQCDLYLERRRDTDNRTV